MARWSYVYVELHLLTMNLLDFLCAIYYMLSIYLKARGAEVSKKIAMKALASWFCAFLAFNGCLGNALDKTAATSMDEHCVSVLSLVCV